MLFDLWEPYAPAICGALGGILLGLAARLGRFCTLGAIEDTLYAGSDHRLRMWGVAIGVAIIASFGLAALGVIEMAGNPYLPAAFNPLAHLFGGLIFGLGMAMAGNCGFGALARLGGGDLRAFVIVLVMGVSAYVVMAGPLAGVRLAIFPRDFLETGALSGYAHLLARILPLPVTLIGIAIGVAVLCLALAAPDFRAERKMIFWGAVVGGAVAYGWAVSSLLAEQSFGAVGVQSYTFVRPIGETILFAMTSSGTTAGFAVGAVGGVWLGAFAGSLIKGHFRWEACEDPRELRRQIFGAVLMGAGAVIAFGCSVGQGLSAMSVLSFGAPLTLLGIFVGVRIGLRSMIVGFHSL